MPIEEDIKLAYDSYYTHEGTSRSRASRNQSFLARILQDMYHGVLRATSIPAERRQIDFGYLEGLPPGRVLDIGCGDGSRLARLRAVGWEVQGQELDAKAAGVARDCYGVPVYIGPLNGAGFGEREFDAVLMYHVIEHVHDPLLLLANCRRFLKSGGTLIAVTPNAKSQGHARFGPFWRGLEPPRHLYIFSPQTIRNLAMRVGFEKVDILTSAANANHFVAGSYQIRASIPGATWERIGVRRRILAACYQFWFRFAYTRNPFSGEECILKAVA